MFSAPYTPFLIILVNKTFWFLATFNTHLKTYTVLIEKLNKEKKRCKCGITVFFYFFINQFLLNHSEQDQEYLSCSCSQLPLPSRPNFLVSYSSLTQHQYKYHAYMSIHVPWFASPPRATALFFLDVSIKEHVFFIFQISIFGNVTSYSIISRNKKKTFA